MRQSRALFLACVAFAAPCVAQPAPTKPPPEPALRRWFEIQNFTAYTRYRFIESSTGVVTSNDVQYKETFRARFNADRKKRYTLNVGAFSGATFTSTWNYTGLGFTDNKADYHSHSVKQLFGSLSPVTGLEGQFGGLYIIRGETTEYSSYDEDGYLVGERVSLRRPKQMYVDEVSITRAALGPTNTPSLFDRGHGFSHPNYTQVLVARRVTPVVAASADYTDLSGADTLRAAVSFRFKATAPLSAFRFEQYHRFQNFAAGDTAPKVTAASGFVLTGERAVNKWLRLVGGYATIDERYGNLNADRMQRGRRFFLLGNITLIGPLSASVFTTRALHATYPIANQSRFDAILQYDVLNSLRKTGKI